MKYAIEMTEMNESPFCGQRKGTMTHGATSALMTLGHRSTFGAVSVQVTV